MSKKDSSKATINILTAAMMVFMTSLLAVIGFIFIHRRNFDFVDGCLVAAGVIGLAMLMCACILWIKKEIKRLEKMK